MKKHISSEYLRQILNYDHGNGEIRWRVRPREHFTTNRACSTWNARFAGKIAGALFIGYRRITIDYKPYLAHRLAWLYMTGDWPSGDLDHVNLDKSSNSFTNLRLATRSQNMANTKVQSNNTSGVKGVCLDKHRNKWLVQIKHNGKKIYIGRYDTIEEADAAYAHAAAKYHGEFGRVA